jgi:hypothetical protein
LKSPAISARLGATRLTGQHASDGFFLFRSGLLPEEKLEDALEAADLHRLIRGALERGRRVPAV